MEVIGTKRRKTDLPSAVVIEALARIEVPLKPMARILKSCARCRQRKTKCDAAERKPLPCTLCSQKNLECVPEIVDAPKKRPGDVVEQLNSEVLELKNTLDKLIDRKSQMIDMLVLRGLKFPKDLHFEVTSIPLPLLEYSDDDGERDEYEEEDEEEEDEEEEAEEEGYLDDETNVDVEYETEPIIRKDMVEDPDFCGQSKRVTATTTIQLPPTPHQSSLEFEEERKPSTSSIDGVSFKLGSFVFSLAEIHELFENFRIHFHKYLPIFPREFLYDPMHVYNESDLLFWAIVGVSHLNGEQGVKFQMLAESIKALVVEKCWYNTPRSVHTLLALLILTTWSLPKNNNGGFELSVTYLSLMRSLALQLGLHRLGFIHEFSHKTTVGISKYSSDNNQILRERIYKCISVSYHSWYLYLGYPQNDEEDHIISQSFHRLNGIKNSAVEDDLYINALLKLSFIQMKISQTLEAADTSITGLYRVNQTKRFIDLGMFEQILNDLERSSVATNGLIKLGIQYLQLQLYLFAFSPLDKFKIDFNLDSNEYKSYVYKALKKCFSIVELFSLNFSKESHNFVQIPVFYRFALELSLLTMMRVFHSPLLNSTEEYKTLKGYFQRGFQWLKKPNGWENVDMNDVCKIERTLVKFDAAFVNNKNIIINGSLRENHQNGNNFFLIRWFKGHLVSSLQSEMTSFINECQKGVSKEVNWEKYTFNTDIVAQLGQLIFH